PALVRLCCCGVMSIQKRGSICGGSHAIPVITTTRARVVGVHMIEGRAWNEPLTIGEPPGAREYGPGETFWFPGEGIHRMDHQAGAVTIHVYSPRANVSAGGAGAGALNGLP